MADGQHILLLGATGVSGVEFVKYWLSLAPEQQPYLTLYVRNDSKLYKLLPALRQEKDSSSASLRFRVNVGALTDRPAIDKALSASDSDGFPPVTGIISLLGAYGSFYNFVFRITSAPIADAFTSTILPALRDHSSETRGQMRILALSTPTGLPAANESRNMPWGWWFETIAPMIFMPQGNAEMKGIGEAVMNVNSANDSKAADNIEWTVFRVPILTNGDSSLEVVASERITDAGFTTNVTITRGSMARWLMKELAEENGGRKWVNKAPVVANR